MGIDPIAICNQKPIHPKRENARERLSFVDGLVIGPSARGNLPPMGRAALGAKSQDWLQRPKRGHSSKSWERTIKDARGRVLRRLKRTASLWKSLDDPDWIEDAW